MRATVNEKRPACLSGICPIRATPVMMRQEICSVDLLYLEDLYVGRKFTSGSHVMEAARIKEFAAEFDPQPFHLDDRAARMSPFGGLVASGWHTAAVAMRLLVDGDLRIANGLVGLGGDIAWPRPTRPGDVLRVESEIVEITPSRSKPRGLVTVRSTMVNQNGEAVYVLTARLLVPRRSTHGAAGAA
ncbi:MAG TPA: MaoC family dehydratase [Candidatus Acidoferrales bacterium]|nr:MaoC family dehydratase [Candidatus Acidoferrales bacterium]